MLTPVADTNTDTQNQVSWQSAVWALVPIALNSMTQPSGKVLGMPSNWSFYLNSSPIVVTVKALELLFTLVWRIYSMRSLATAAHSITQDRFSDVGGSRSGLAQLQEIKSVRLIVFVFGALPQIIKLYAMSGVLGTQICASLFFGSFLIIEAITMWSSTYRNTMIGLDIQATNLDNSIRILRRVTLGLSYAFPLCLVLIVTWIKNLPFFTMTMLEVSLLVFTVLSNPYESKSNEPFGKEVFYRIEWPARFIWVTLIRVLMLFLINVGIWELFGFHDYSILFLKPWYGFVFFLILIVAQSLPSEHGPTRLQRLGHLVFILIHIVTAFTTYALMYDPVGTYKPGWTNYLG